MDLKPHSSSFVNCRVCGSYPAQFHFNAVSCRSCAAFFRRFVTSKKMFIHCRCNKKTSSSNPCRLCRMNKCLAVGMNKFLVQGPRDKYASTSKANMEPIVNINHLTLRTFDIIQRVKKSYDIVNNNRGMIQATTTTIQPGEITYFKLSGILKQDFHSLSGMISTAFPEFNQLSTKEVNTIFKNFYPKWNAFETVLIEIKYECLGHWFHEKSYGEKVFALEQFYNNDHVELLDENVMTMFARCWEFLFEFKKLIANIRLDEIEEMCILALLFCDTGYTNLSSKTVEVCESIRNCIYRELKTYCLEKDKDELRFFEILNTLPLIEKAERKNIEELQLCSLHNIMVDQEYYNIMNTSKY